MSAQETSTHPIQPYLAAKEKAREESFAHAAHPAPSTLITPELHPHDHGVKHVAMRSAAPKQPFGEVAKRPAAERE